MADNFNKVPTDTEPERLTEPGEVATPLTPIRELETYDIPLGGGGHLIGEGHTVADVLRFLIERTSYEEVRCTLEVMDAPSSLAG